MVYSKLPYLYRMALASVSKVLVLFCTAYIFVSLGIVPKIFLTAMGLMQLITALVGGFLAFIILNKKNANKVVEVVEKGYRQGDKVIRATKVKIGC